MTLGLACLALAAALAGYPIAGAGAEKPAELSLAGCGLFGVLLALTVAQSIPASLWLALLGIAAEYMTHQIARGLPPASAIAYGAGLLVLCELTTWSATCAPRAMLEESVVVRRAVTLTGTALGAAGVSSVVFLGSGFDVGSALAAAVTGVFGAVGILALTRRLARA